MKKRDYDTEYDETTGGTETQVAVDTKMKKTIAAGSTKGDRNEYEEGFAAASGVRPETAASGGRIRHPEDKDSAHSGSRVPDPSEKENSGLADN